MYDTTEREQLKRDVVSAFHSVLKDEKCKSIEAAFEILGTYPAPRFYVSYETARRCVSLVNRGKQPHSSPHKRKMYKELHKRWKQYCLRTGTNSFEPLEAILLEPAPSFYLASDTLRQIVYKNRRK